MVEASRKSLKLIVMAAAVAAAALILYKTLPARSEQTARNLIATSVQQRVEWSNANGGRETLTFVYMPIPESDSFKSLRTDYLHRVYGEQFSPNLEAVRPTMIVLHSMALGTLKDALVQSGLLDSEIHYGASRWGKMPVGTHFLVDRDGTIYCLASPRNVAGAISYAENAHFPLKRHVIEANPWAIGIENIAPFVRDWTSRSELEKAKIFSELTHEQVRANAQLIRWLVSWNPAIKHVFGHHQFSQAEFRAKLIERRELIPVTSDPAYVTSDRFDPGEDFLRSVLTQVNEQGYSLRFLP